MNRNQVGYGFAALLVVAGAILMVVGSIFLAMENAEEARCRAANDGLDELSCMNFASIPFAMMMAWGLGAVGLGLLVALGTWAWPRLRTPARA